MKSSEIVVISKLPKLLTKGPYYWQPRSINFYKAFTEITTGLDKCTEAMLSQSKHNVNNFGKWKKMNLEKINLNIEKSKTKR